MAHRPNRRGFLKQSAVLGGGFWVAGAEAAEESKSPNEKLNIGIVGVNNRGRANTGGVRSENIVALCDIDDNYLNQ
ncbi:MAG: twin-arginine translocation signal domain-containing protein, partial [Pirellulales bacterium]